eukprot:GHUV01003326.1.p1 GENE.GHUV01003326.1~~GHUV01003326.1.p1  ORF type:complete len:153 (+),score=23.71 GHUV01003326.1:672-1130(+)
MPKQYSRYVLVVDNLSSATPTKEVAYEFEAAGKIRDIARDYKARCAIIEFDRSSDAKWAWDKMDGFRMDGRRWKVDWASRDDFDLFGWKWFEGGRSPSPRVRGRSVSRSRPLTPHDQDRKGGQSSSPSRDKGQGKEDRSRSPSPSNLRTDNQ